MPARLGPNGGILSGHCAAEHCPGCQSCGTVHAPEPWRTVPEDPRFCSECPRGTGPIALRFIRVWPCARTRRGAVDFESLYRCSQHAPASTRRDR